MELNMTRFEDVSDSELENLLAEWWLKLLHAQNVYQELFKEFERRNRKASNDFGRSES